MSLDRNHLYTGKHGYRALKHCPSSDATSDLELLATWWPAQRHMNSAPDAWQVQLTSEGFHLIKVAVHSGMHCLCVPLKVVVGFAAPTGSGLAGLLPRLGPVTGNVDGPVHMDQAVHHSMVGPTRAGVSAVDHSVAAANQPPAGGHEHT